MGKGAGRRDGIRTMNVWLRQLGTLGFWEALLDSFGGLGPIAPIVLAMVESFFPPLPLVAIVALNVAAHGGLLGFLYSWAGVALGGCIMFLLWRRVVKRFFWKFASRLITMLLGKGVMVALIALFGQSLVSSLKNPVYLVLAILLWAGMYWVSKKFCKKHNLE